MNSAYIAGQDGTTTETRGGGLPDWRELVTIVIERIWYGIAVAIVVMLFFYWQMSKMVPTYRSTAVLMVEIEQPRILQHQEVVSSNIRSLEYFNTVINILHSRQMMETALQDSGLAEHPGFLSHIDSLAGKAAAALRMVHIQPVDRSRLIRISVEYTDPQLASELANAMAHSYIRQELENRMTISMQAVDWLQERADEFREKLEAGLQALQQYREAAQSVSLEEDQNIVIAKLKSLNTSLSAAQSERISVQSQWEAIARQIEAGVSRSRIAPQLQDAGLSEMQTQLLRHQQQLGILRDRYLEGHPELAAALQQERHLQGLFDEAFDTAAYALQSRYETLRARELNLRQALQDQEQEAFGLARQLVQYNELRRNVDADKEIYEAVIARMKQANVAGSLPSEVIRIAEEARPAGAPFRPNRPRLLFRGGVIAGVAGFGVIFLLYYADHRFRRNEEVERSLGVPVLTSLPVISGKDIRTRGLVSLEHPTGEVAEGFRTLRAILGMSPMGEHAKVMLMTSTQPAEGKSLISINLAISHARNNRRTLLIGADMRRPAFRKIFPDLSLACGLSNVLNGERSWQDAVQSCGVDNLDIIEAGKGDSRPAEMLGGTLFSEVVEEMRDRYDRILIDAPPVLGVSDTLILLKHADAVLFVVRYGLTHSLGAIQAMRRIQASETPCIGVVMNGVDVRSIANYYYYRRYGGYAYHSYARAAKPSASEKRESRRQKRRAAKVTQNKA